MAESVVEPRRPTQQRFFCHRCNVDFETVLQDYTCPYCSSGFIERLEHDDTLSNTLDDEEYSDADMSNLEDGSHLEDTMEDSDDPSRANAAAAQPMLNDLTFLMTGGRLRPGGSGGRRVEGGRSLLEQLVWMIGGARGNVTTAGAPFVLVGAPGDYVFGGEGLDAVVTQLLGQLENSGPPPLPSDQIQAIPSVEITAEQVAGNMACSVCWDNFTLGEKVSRLECEHIFHPSCITPWLQLHATCPICRRSLASQAPAGMAQAGAASAGVASAGASPTASETVLTPTSSSSTQEARSIIPGMYSRVVVRRLSRRRRSTPPGSHGGSDTSSSSRGLWSALTSQLAAAAAGSPSSAPSAAPSAPLSQSTSSSDATYMDIDFD